MLNTAAVTAASHELAVIEREILRRRSISDSSLWPMPLQFSERFAEFRRPSWRAWKQRVLSRINPRVRELYAICGRGSGKSRNAALIAACFATREYRRAPGERIYIGAFAPDRKQARVTFRYTVGLLRSDPGLERLIERELRESVDLTNGVTIEVITASAAAPRSRAYALAIIEEAAYLPHDDSSANPDTDLVIALRPALARVPGSLLAVVSSPYAERGIVWEASQRYGEGSCPPEVVYIRAPTLELNPEFDRAEIERAREEDPAAASAEYDAEFRKDIQQYTAREIVEASVVQGRLQIQPARKRSYFAFVDAAGGSGGDSYTLCIAHLDSRRVVLDVIREVQPPFSPELVTEDFCNTLSEYEVTEVTGDRYAGEWPREQYRKRGVSYEVADRAKSDLYRDALPILNSGRIELLDLPRLKSQIIGLERRTGGKSRDLIDHAPRSHDDVANAALGAVAELTKMKQKKRAGVAF